MNNAFLDQAEKAVTGLLQAYKPKLIKAYGTAEFETKKDNTVVTLLDRELEQKLRDVLKPLNPEIGFLGEELGQEGDNNTYWLLDPIDGTEQFIRGIDSCKNLLCLVENGEPVWALMYFFVRNELWTARRGQGTFCDGQQVQMRYRPLELCWLDISVSLLNTGNLRRLLNVRPKIAGFSIMRDTSLVISGKVDGVIALETGGGPWDYAPRSLLLKEAGAKITNIGSDNYDFNNPNFLVAHPRNFDQIMQLISV